jgi:CRP-like cAMP-binding protein
MLQAQSEFVRDCFQRAARAREIALAAIDPAKRSDYLAQEQRWLSLARSEEFTERVSRFLSSQGTRSARRDLVIPLFREVASNPAELRSMCDVIDQACRQLGILKSDRLYEFVANIVVDQAKNGCRAGADLQAATLAALGVESVSARAEHSDSNSFLRLVQKQTSLVLRPVEYERERVLFTEGEKVSTVYFTESAVIALRMPSAEQSMEVATIGPDGGVGALAALDGGTVHYRAVVLIGGRGFACLATHFREAVLDNRALLEATLRFERQISAQCGQVAICNVAHLLTTRLARWLTRVHDLSGQASLAFTQEMMAEWLGVRRTSVTLAATHLQRLSAIEYRRGVVKITDLGKLRAIACDCCRT